VSSAKVSQLLCQRFAKLIGQIIGLLPSREKIRLCVDSTMGQIILYVPVGPGLVGFWSELKSMAAQLDRLANYIADFSLACL
jgi:hypothetical protein